MDKPRMIMTRAEVLSVTPPAETRTYKPVAHRRLIDLALEGMEKEGYQLTREEYRGAEQGRLLTAYYDFTYGNDPEMGMRLALQNSYNKKVSLKGCLGTSVFVCSNGCFYGTVGAFKKKHMGTVQTFAPEKMGELIKTSGEVYHRLVQDKDRMKELEINRKVIAELVGDLFINEQLITSEQLNIIKGEVENPSFNYNAPGSVWEAYNHFTHAGKITHPAGYIEFHQKLHDYFTQRFSLAPKAEATSIYISLPQ